MIGNEGKHFCAGANVFVIWMAVAARATSSWWTGWSAAMQSVADAHALLPQADRGRAVRDGPGRRRRGVHGLAAAGWPRPRPSSGLVEVGSVGVIPAGTGTKEMLRRVVNPVMRIPNADPISVMQKVFEQIATAKVATGAQEAIEFGVLRAG